MVVVVVETVVGLVKYAGVVLVWAVGLGLFVGRLVVDCGYPSETAEIVKYE